MGGDPSVLDANYPPQLTVGPLGGGDGRGGVKEGRMGGGLGGALGGFGMGGGVREGRLGGVQVGRIGVGGGGGSRWGFQLEGGGSSQGGSIDPPPSN